MDEPVSAHAGARTARVIVALDVDSIAGARALVDRLDDACDFYKVGSELFTAAGPDVVRWLRERGKEVFLDLKFHDIPNTVRGATRSAAALGVSLLTVHATGGADMLAAALDGAGPGTQVFAVTVLTSFGAADLAASWGRSVAAIDDEVLRLAELAQRAGVPGIVCAGSDAPRVRERFGDRLALLIPGIRLAGGASHDQTRIATPRAAAAAGARYIVLGRAVTAATDPAAALREVERETGAAVAGGRWSTPPGSEDRDGS